MPYTVRLAWPAQAEAPRSRDESPGTSRGRRERDQLKGGDEVFGVGVGTFAEYALASASKLVQKPADLGFEQAAVVPMSGAHRPSGPPDSGGIQPGQQVLIAGAGGGVGTYAVQIAARLARW